jgi:hypothetical protein
MTHAHQQSYRGVLCRCCKQPIPVSPFVVVMQPESDEEQQRVRVFSVRCRACEKERPYRSSDIVEFEGTPRSTRGARPNPVAAPEIGGIGRAANA